MTTIEFFTGFEGCESDDDVHILFESIDSNTLFESSNGYNNSKSLMLDADGYSDEGYCQKDITAAKTVVCGFHVKNLGKSDYNTDYREHLIRMDADGTYIRVFNTSNGLEVYRDDTLIASSSYTISTDITHVEFKVYSHASEGTIGLKINGETKIDEAGLDTTGNDITKIRFAPCRAEAYFDNIFIADDWIGELKTKLLQPTSDDSVQFTPSDGSDNYTLLQNNDGDDNYVYSDTVDHKDLYGYGPDIANDQYVKGVFVQQVARKDDTNARSLQTVMEVESTEYDLDEYVLPNEYPTSNGEVQFQVLGKAPDDTDWTYEKVNGMKVGFKVSA